MTMQGDNTQPRVRSEALRIYIAASSAEMDRVHRAASAARAVGIEVVSTWPVVVANTPGGANPRDASHEDRAQWSGTDLAEVESANALWFLVPNAQTRGAWVEVGYALHAGKTVVCSGDTKQSVFCALADEFDTDEQALAYLAAMQRAWSGQTGEVGGLLIDQTDVKP